MDDLLRGDPSSAKWEWATPAQKMARRWKSERRDSDKNSAWHLIGASPAVMISGGNPVIPLLVQFEKWAFWSYLKSSWTGCEVQPPSRWPGNARNVNLGLWVPLPSFTGSRGSQAPEDSLASTGFGRFLGGHLKELKVNIWEEQRNVIIVFTGSF